jgi:hypothetical protein
VVRVFVGRGCGSKRTIIESEVEIIGGAIGFGCGGSDGDREAIGCVEGESAGSLPLAAGLIPPSPDSSPCCKTQCQPAPPVQALES